MILAGPNSLKDSNTKVTYHTIHSLPANNRKFEIDKIKFSSVFACLFSSKLSSRPFARCLVRFPLWHTNNNKQRPTTTVWLTRWFLISLSFGVCGGSVPSSSSFSSGLSSGHHVGIKKLLSNIASITRNDDESGGMSKLDNYLKDKLLCKDMELDLLVWWKTNEEIEAYCRSIEFDYDVEEENTKESRTTSLDDFV
uniref:Uncharacterized protein n=1 Tax=Lactuca sativa TaxID=4236 RepID=A0A9R1VQ27_LACSA|nr:hypothetical protein LSAT_V11C400165560 [Lactuca sativa]